MEEVEGGHVTRGGQLMSHRPQEGKEEK
jgi:hypothetical protein